MIFKKKKRTFFGELLFIGRLLACLFSFGLCIAGLSVDLSACGYLLVILQFFCTVSLIAPLGKGTAKRYLAIVSVASVFCLIIFGILQNTIQPKEGRVYGTDQTDAARLSGILQERDLVLTMARFLPFIGGLSFREAQGLIPSIIKSYDEMELEQGKYSSLLIDSLAGLPHVLGSEVLTFNAKFQNNPKSAVLFLHGTGGNFGLICWIISKGSQSIGAATYCPTLNLLGNWGSDKGRKIVADLIVELRSKGIEHLYLVGLSSGAVGVGRIAASLENEFDAVALLFGAHPAIKSFGKAILFMYGRNDERFPVQLLSWVASLSAKTNPNVTINIVQGGHFFALQHREQFLELFGAWLLKEAR